MSQSPALVFVLSRSWCSSVLSVANSFSARRIILQSSARLTLCEVSVRSTWVWTVFLCVFAFPCFAQSSVPPRPTMPPPPRNDVNPPTGDENEAQARLAAEMAKRAAKERVAALKHDTDKLLKLSVELKESVDKSDENVLSLDVIKKAEEIEKLARSVKDKMKGPN
jgi:hypothetical protein